MVDYLYDLPNSTAGMDNILIQVVTVVPAFVPLLLLFVFLIILMGGSARQKARTGSADFPMWAVIASMSTLMIALMLSITSTSLMNIDWLVITVVVTIFSGVWFFINSKQSEV